jgi:hypothetical protein
MSEKNWWPCCEHCRIEDVPPSGDGHDEPCLKCQTGYRAECFERDDELSDLLADS